MPLYEYQCDACGQRFEIIRKFSDPLVDRCPKCGSGPVHKLLSSPAIQFKGSGWYITDYARKDSTTAADKKPESTEKSDGGTTTDKPEKKSDKKTDATASPTKAAADPVK